jgi:hypothetical protein
MGMFDYSPIDIFKFEKRDVTNYMLYKLHLGSKIKDCFNYLGSKLGVQELPESLSDLKWSEGKNYDWAFFKKDNVTFGLRQYHEHFTIFTKREKAEDDWNARYSIFTFHANTEKMNEFERAKHEREYDEHHTIELQKYIGELIEMAKKNELHALWNDYSFKRSKYIDVKCYWSGGDSDIEDIDGFNYACEEIFNKSLEVFAENDMHEAVKKVKIGDKLGEYTVTGVNKALKDGYYHNVGIKWKSDKKEEFNDVYRLTRWHFALLFPQRWNISK